MTPSAIELCVPLRWGGPPIHFGSQVAPTTSDRGQARKRRKQGDPKMATRRGPTRRKTAVRKPARRKTSPRKSARKKTTRSQTPRAPATFQAAPRRPGRRKLVGAFPAIVLK